MEPVSPLPMRGLTLLYVEDEAEARNMVTRMLGVKFPDLTLLSADNGVMGLEAYREKRPDIVLTDINMPLMDGIQMAREIKAIDPNAIVVAVTAYTDVSFLLSAIEIGINHYVLKPIDYRQLAGLVERITEQLSLRRVVAEQQERIVKLSQAVEQSQSMVVITDDQGAIEYANPKFFAFTGFGPDEVLGTDFPHFMELNAVSPVPPQMWQTVTSGDEWRGEVQNRKKNGEIYYELVSISPIKDETGRVINAVAVKEDITAAKRQEMEIQRLKNYLVDLVNSMPAVLVGIKVDETVTQWNRQAELLTGIAAGEAVGRPAQEVLADFYPFVQTLWEEIQRDRQPKQADRIVLSGRDEESFFDMILYPLMDGTGAVVKIEDVTERVRAQEMLLHTEKMASLGRLAFGMAHEVNNPLNVITQSARNIERRLSHDLPANRESAEVAGVTLEQLQRYFDERQVQKFLDSIREAAGHAGSIINSILRLSHAEKAPMEPTAPQAVLERAVELFERTTQLKQECEQTALTVTREFAEEVPQVPMVAVEIEQVVLNLLTNAGQALSEECAGEPRMVLRLAYDEEYVTIEVEDNGPGMPQEVRDRVFEPFFSTREVGEGAGLGLSVSYWIVTHIHKGRMEVESELGSGTKVTVRLPRA